MFKIFHFFITKHILVTPESETRSPTRRRSTAIAEYPDALNTSIKSLLCPEDGLSIYLQILPFLK